MAQKASTGVATTQSIVFNSGYLTIGSSLVADVSNIVISSTFSAKDYRTLNSIKKRAIRRATLDQNIKFSIEGGSARKLYELFFSSSSPTNDPGQLYTVKDGQQIVQTVMVTCYENDDTTKAYQYVLSNPTMTSHTWNLSTEAFEKVDVEFMCTEITLYVDNAVSN